MWGNPSKRWDMRKGSRSGWIPGDHDRVLAPLLNSWDRSPCTDVTSGFSEGRWFLPSPVGFQWCSTAHHIQSFCKLLVKKQNVPPSSPRKQCDLQPVKCQHLRRCSEWVCVSVLHMCLIRIFFYWKGCESVSWEFETEQFEVIKI